MRLRAGPCGTWCHLPPPRLQTALCIRSCRNTPSLNTVTCNMDAPFLQQTETQQSEAGRGGRGAESLQRTLTSTAVRQQLIVMLISKLLPPSLHSFSSSSLSSLSHCPLLLLPVCHSPSITSPNSSVVCRLLHPLIRSCSLSSLKHLSLHSSPSPLLLYLPLSASSLISVQTSAPPRPL